MTGLRDLIGTAAVKAMTELEWANVNADFPDRAARTIIAALKANGLMVVPVELQGLVVIKVEQAREAQGLNPAVQVSSATLAVSQQPMQAAAAAAVVTMIVMQTICLQVMEHQALAMADGVELA